MFNSQYIKVDKALNYIQYCDTSIIFSVISGPHSMRMVSRKACLSTMLVLTFFLAIVYLNRIEERLPQVQTVQTIPLLADSLHTLQHHQSSHLFSARRSLSKEPSHSVHRYILSLSYWEQLTMGVRNLFSVACFGSLWNMTVVQPFTYNSRLYGLPNLKPGEYSDTMLARVRGMHNISVGASLI